MSIRIGKKIGKVPPLGVGLCRALSFLALAQISRFEENMTGGIGFIGPYIELGIGLGVMFGALLCITFGVAPSR